MLRRVGAPRRRRAGRLPRARTVVALAAARATGACSALVDLDGLGGGEPLEAGAPRLDAGARDGGGFQPLVPDDADASPGPACEAGVHFCDDFERGEPRGAWTRLAATGDSGVAIGSEASGNRFLEATVAASEAGRGQLVQLTTPAPPPRRCASASRRSADDPRRDRGLARGQTQLVACSRCATAPRAPQRPVRSEPCPCGTRRARQEWHRGPAPPPQSLIDGWKSAFARRPAAPGSRARGPAPWEPRRSAWTSTTSRSPLRRSPRTCSRVSAGTRCAPERRDGRADRAVAFDDHARRPSSTSTLRWLGADGIACAPDA